MLSIQFINSFNSNYDINYKSVPQIDSSLTLSELNWNERAVVKLDNLEHSLDKILPSFFFQKKIDQLGAYIEKKFAPLHAFNHWLNSNGEGAWYRQLATFLCKLPLRVARNFISLFYRLVRAALQTAVHPVKAIIKLAKFVVQLVHMLTLPEVWSKMGASILSASLGQASVAGGPVSIIGAGIGGAMMIGGISLGALKAFIRAKQGEGWKETGKALFYQVEQIPEAMLTGFTMGLLLGAIQREINNKAQSIYNEAVKSGVNKKLEEYSLPPSSHITLDASRAVEIKWPIEAIPAVKRWYMQKYYNATATATEFTLKIPSEVANIPPLVLPDWLQHAIERAPLTAGVLPLSVS